MGTKGSCCAHCSTIANLDTRLDTIDTTLAVISQHVELLKKLVYGAVAAVLTSAVTFGASKMVSAFF